MAEARSDQLDSIRAFGLMAVIFQHSVKPKGPIAGGRHAAGARDVLRNFRIPPLRFPARGASAPAFVGLATVPRSVQLEINLSTIDERHAERTARSSRLVE